MGKYFCRVNKRKQLHCHFIFHFLFILILEMQCVKTRVGGNYSPMYVPSNMHSCLVPDRWTCRDVNEIFLRTLKYSRLTNVSLCFSIDLPIAQSGTGDFKRAAVSWCQWPEKSLYEVQSWPSPLYHHSPPLTRAADTGHSHHCCGCCH